MDQLPPFKPEQGDILTWIKQFKLLCSLHNVENYNKALWCQSVVGSQELKWLPVWNVIHMTQSRLPHCSVYGAHDPALEAQLTLQNLQIGEQAIQQLAVRVRGLTGWALQGATKVVKDSHAIRVFLQALPRIIVTRDVKQMPQANLDVTCRETERQSALNAEHS